MKAAQGKLKTIRGLAFLALGGACGIGLAFTSGKAAPPSQVVQKEPLALTYMANCGVLLSSGGSRVLVDALFDKPNPEYRAPASEVLNKMMKGEAPFDGVDLVLVTHNHPDHFDAGLAVRYLEARPGPVLVAPSDAVEAMRKVAADWSRIGPRVVPLDIKVGEKDRREAAGISVSAFRTLHSGDLESPMNLMYVFELNGWRVWHEGDSNGKPEVFQHFGLGALRLDLALVHFWFPMEPNCSRFLQEALKTDHIGLTHLPIRLEGDAPGKVEVVRQYYKDLFLLLPGMPAKIFLPASTVDILTAVKNGDLEQVKSILKKNPELIRTKDEYKNSLLRVALLNNDFVMARFLIESGIDLNYAREDIGSSEIFVAIDVGSLEITRLIFEKGVDINLKNKWGHAPLDAAIFGGYKEIAYFLMDRGAALNIQGQGVGRLLRAALGGGMDRITNLLIKEKNVDYRNVDALENTLLHAIAQSGGTTFIDLLIEKGVDPNARNVYGWTPLHSAALHGHRKMIEALLKKGADKNVRTKDGKTPFNIAEELGPKDILPYLKAKGLAAGPAEFPKLDAPHIDPNVPGPKPVRFAAGIVSQPHHFEHSMFSFTADMKTACWADWQRMGISKIFVMENKDGLWQPPRIVQLKATSPFIAPDGNRIFFTAPRTLPDGTEAGDSDVFYIEKTETGWSDRVNLGPNVNSESDDIKPAVTRDGTLYFCHNADIYRSKPVDGRYAPKEKLPAPINSESTQAEPYIAPDESFLLFRSLGRGGMMEPNYYFSSRNADGTWAEPINIAKKVKEIGLFPSLTPDRKYMISFLGGDYYWFDISAVMEELANAQKKDFPNPTGAYLGQKPPGMTPEIFAPGIVSSPEAMEYGIAFSPDGKELYFNRNGVGVMVSTWSEAGWTAPIKAPFLKKFKGGAVHITYDGKRLLMNRYPGVHELKEGESGGIWASQKTADGWDNPLFLIADGMRATSTLDGAIYTTDISGRKGGKDQGIIAKYVPSGSGYRRAPDPGGGVNTENSEAHPFIAPDESYVLFDSSRPGGKGKGDLYVCFRLADGSWSRAFNDMIINTPEADWCATVSPDGKYLFFTRNGTGNGDIYWVDAKIIEKLKPKEYK